MAFNTLFIAHAPDADKDKHRSSIVTGKYKLFCVVVKDQKESLIVAKEFVEKEKIDSILLCPGFTHSDIAEIVKVVGSNVSVCVARGDGPSSRISQEAFKRESFFAPKTP
jgi:hypothetical protein